MRSRARRPIGFEFAFLRSGPEGAGVEPEGVVPLAPLALLETAAARPLQELHDELDRRLAELDAAQGKRSFCGGPVPADGGIVVPVIRFDAAAFDEQPSLERLERGGAPRCLGLLEGIAWTLLLEAARALRGAGSEPLLEHWSRDPEDVLRTAGRLMMVTAGRATGHPQGLIGLFDEINEIASLRHEGREPSGRLLVARRGHPSLSPVLRLVSPVPLAEAAWARKILEMASTSVSLHCDSLALLGLARVGEYEARREDLFVVEFAGHQRWELRHGGLTLMRVAYGIPTLPEEPLGARDVRAALRAELGRHLDEAAVSRIWRVVRGAIAQPHGALVVVTERAREEASRLANQGVPIEPTVLDDETALRVTSLDGAVLLDTLGHCHAVGVILDGRSRPEIGSPARGARFNSAARYIDGTEGPALAVVVSEDGGVDLLRRSTLPRPVAEPVRREPRPAGPAAPPRAPHAARAAGMRGRGRRPSRGW